MIHSSQPSRQGGMGATPADATRQAGGKPMPQGKGEHKGERKGDASGSPTPPAPSTRLQQRSRTAAPTEGRPGPAAQFLGRTGPDTPQHPVIDVGHDGTTHTGLLTLDLDAYFKDRLGSGAITLTPTLMDELSTFARKITLEGSDATTALVYGSLLDNADASTLGTDLIKPIFRSLVHGPAYLPADKLIVAVQSICALFPDCVLPDAWLRAVMQAAREALDDDNSKMIATMTRDVLLTAAMALPDERREALERSTLQLALQECAQAPEQPIGLIAWMHARAMHCQPRAVAAKVLDALRELPDLAPLPMAAVMVTLSAGTVMPLASDGSAPAEPLALILPWALQLPESHRAQALAGIAQGMARAGLPEQASAAHLRTTLRVIGELESQIQAAGVQGWVGMILSHALPAPQDNAPVRGRKKTAAADASVDENWPAQAVAGLRAVLVGPPDGSHGLDHWLPVLGGALASLAGASDAPARTMHALASGLVASPIPTRHTSQVLVGMAIGAGASAMKDDVLGAFIEPIARADMVRGAVLACHLYGVIGAAGGADRKSSSAAAGRMARAIESLPAQALERPPSADASTVTPLALGMHMASAPLEAVRLSKLPQADQLQLLEAALEMPGGLGQTILTQQVFDCALVAGEDVDFAFEAALLLCDQLDTQACEPLVRQLRAALLPQVIASSGSPEGASVRAARLNSLARVYERASRNLWVERAQAEIQIEFEGLSRESKAQRRAVSRPAGPQPFLASEAALMRSGPHADLLAPLAVKLEKLAAMLGAVTVSASLSTSS